MKKILAFLLVMIFIVSIVFAGISCKKEVTEETTAAKATVETTAAKVTEETTAAKAKEGVTHPGFEGQTLIVSADPDSMLKNGVIRTQEFEKAYGVKVDYTEVGWDVNMTQMPQRLVVGEPMDVIITINSFWYEYPDKHTALDNLFPEMFSEMIPELVDYGTFKNKIVAVPFLPAYTIMYYNKDMFKKAGIEKLPEDWNELKVAIKKLNDFNGQYNFIQSWNIQEFYQGYILYIKAAGKDAFEIVNGELKWNLDSPESIAALTFMKELYDENLVSPGILTETMTEVTARYSSGEVGMIYTYDSFCGFIDPTALAFTGFFPFPGKEKGKSATADGHEYLAIPVSAPNPKLAVEYIKWMAGYENSTKRCLEEMVFPLYKKQLEDPEIMTAVPYAEATNLAKDFLTPQMPPIEAQGQMRLEVGAAFQKAILGEVSIEEACANAMKIVKGYKYIPLE